MAVYPCLVFLFCVLWLGQATASDLQLKMASLVYRHGDRSPVTTFPKDQHFSFWKQGLGQLTQKGMGQEFDMGEFLKKRYTDKILNETYLRKQVYCRSSDSDRTLMSAEAQMAGLYPPKHQTPLPETKEWQFWQLIPIHTVSKREDHLLRGVMAKCPKYQKLQEKSFNTPEYKNMEKKYKEFIYNASVGVGLKDALPLKDIYKIADLFFCQRAHNLSLPSWVTDDVFNTLEELALFTFTWLFNSHEKQRLTGGALIGEIIGNMDTYLDNPSKSKRLYVYSAHDVTVAALLVALGIFNDIRLPYSAVTTVELYQNTKTKDDIVRIFYRNDSKKSEPYELTLPHCSPCTLEKFKSLTADMIPENINEECGNSPSCEEKHCTGFFAGLIAAGALLIIVLVILIIVITCRKKRVINQTEDSVPILQAS